MIDWLTTLLLICSMISLALFFFIVRFAVKTEMVVTAGLFTLIISVGVFSWAMQTFFEDEGLLNLWYNVGYLCGILMFPLLIFLFLQRAGSTSFLVTTVHGRMIVFVPFVIQILAHYLLHEDSSRFSDFIFLIVWLVITVHVWQMLFTRMQEASSVIRRNQMVFMLSTFFVVIIYNLNIIFNLFISYEANDYTFIYGIAVLGALIVTIRGFVQYQTTIGTELLVRNSLIMLLTSIICVTAFVIGQLVVLSMSDYFDPTVHIAASTGLVIGIILFINPITASATYIVERVSPQLKWKESDVREIFILHTNGLVIAHASSHDAGLEMDRDLVGGMLTAIQNFVMEAFLTSEMETLKSLNVGNLRMLIEAKGDIVAAVLFTGHEAKELRKDVMLLIEELDHRFGHKLHSWKGEKRDVRDVQEWLEKVLTNMKRRA